jgi:AraC family ethanolamine operon transcriptional activator
MAETGTVLARPAASEEQPGLRIRRFTDLDELAAAMQHADAEFVALGPSRDLDALVVSVDLGEGAVLQIGAVNLDHLTRGRIHGDSFHLSFPMRVDGALSWNGRPMDDRTAILARPGAEVQANATGAERWATLILERARFERTLAASMGAESIPFPESCRFVTLGEPLHGILQAELARVAEVAVADPEALAAPEVRRALGEKLVGLAIRSLESLPRRTPDRERTVHGHSRVVAGAEEFMRSRLSLPLYVGDLCQATGVSERTLRSAFRNVYGMGPNRLLKLRRIHQVRRALEHGSEHTLVSEVAQRHGFWDLGRFAGDYRRVVGESPSQTLRRARGEVQA